MLKLRPFQKKSLSLLEKPAHLVCVAPTGSGKSLIYEKLSSKAGTRTLLVSPLIALARQQKQRLENAGVPVALATGGENSKPPMGRSGVWIVSPESIQSSFRRNILNHWKPDFLVVDECHCLWDWGEKFRPAFSQLPALIAQNNISRSLWLSATIPPQARALLRLNLPHPYYEVGDFDLPTNLRLVVSKTSWSHRLSTLLRWIQSQKGPGIVFAPTRESTHRLANILSTTYQTAVYHAGMSREERLLIEKSIDERKVQIRSEERRVGKECRL